MKRDRLNIIYDILNKIRESNNKIKITPLLRYSNVSSSRFKQYFIELKNKEFISEVQIKNDNYVELTEKGYRFLDKYRTIINFIDEFEL